MKFLTIYRASFYLMLTFATLVLSIDATDDNRFAMLYPVVVALASVAAFLTVDRDPKFGLSRTAASVLALISGGLSVAEYRYDNTLLLLSAAHWLVYLQLVKMFLPKTVEDDWFLFLLGLVQVLVGGVMSQSDKVGIALFSWALMALWVLILFALHREALRMKVAPMAETARARGDRAEPYRGLIDVPFIVSTARVAATTLALGGLIFLAMPRRTSMGSSQSSGALGRHLTGFDDEIQLGQLGEILENDTPVMSVELLDNEGSRIVPGQDDESRWRGVSMDRYERGRWFRPKFKANGYSLGLTDRWRESRVVRQQIKLEPTDSPVLFGLRPILDADAPDKRFLPELNEADGTLFRNSTLAVSFDYSVDSADRADLPQPGEAYPSVGYLSRLVSIPDDLKARLRPIALDQVRGIDEGDLKGRTAALERYLKDSGEFRYSLEQDTGDPNLDPVEDFLINRKTGHCEYFASALALLLRSIDIPCRIINGFKGGDYNAMARITTVRQKHAHSWVEALVGRTQAQDPAPDWITLDPTPSAERNASISRVGGMASHFYQVTDFVRFVWIFYIVGFNSERQDRFLYAPIRALIKEAQRGFSIMGDSIKGWFHFPSVESFFSLRGFLVSFGALLVLVGVINLVAWCFRRLMGRFAGKKENDPTGMAGVQFYRRLMQLLAEYGLERPAAETPREFARRSAIFLAGHGSGTESVADVPPLVVDAFYQIRFGERTLREDDLEHITSRLDALDARIHPQKA